MSAQKLMIIVLVALAVIFVITLGIRGCHDTDRPDPDDSGFVGALKGLQGNRFLQIGDDASTTCDRPTSAQTLQVDDSCRIDLEERAFFRRSTRVALQANRSLDVSVRPNDGPDQDVELPVDGKFCFGSSINRAGGRITLSGTNVMVVLRREGCPK
jgi:hypothetical protein